MSARDEWLTPIEDVTCPDPKAPGGERTIRVGSGVFRGDWSLFKSFPALRRSFASIDSPEGKTAHQRFLHYVEKLNAQPSFARSAPSFARSKQDGPRGAGISGHSESESYVAIRDYEGVDELSQPFDFKTGVSIIHGSWSTLSKQPELMRYLAPTGNQMGLRARNEALAIQRSKRDKPHDYLAPDDSDRASWYLPAGTTVTVEREIPELRRSVTPTITVSLPDRAWKDLRRHAGEARDGRETAGFLFGHRVLSSQPVSIGWVTRMVKDRAADSAAFDIEALIAEKAILRASGVRNVGELGCWHTHPSAYRHERRHIGLPSETDLTTWLSALDYLKRSHYVGLILTAEPNDQRWYKPTVHGWVVRRANHSARTAICEPAIVETGRG